MKKDPPFQGMKIQFVISLLWGERRPRGYDITGMDYDAAEREIAKVCDKIERTAVGYFINTIKYGP